MLRLALGEDPSSIHNLAFRENGDVRTTERRLPPWYKSYRCFRPGASPLVTGFG